MKYKRREIENKIKQYLEIFPVVSLTGSRQSGKSTLLKNTFTKGWKYYSLDEIGLHETILNDPDLFLSNQKSNFIIDEAQKLPQIFHAIKCVVDQGYPFKIILSGSANFLLLSQITESLAGRVGVIELYPFSYPEITQTPPSDFLTKLFKINNISVFPTELTVKPLEDLNSYIFYGGYPKIIELNSHQSKSIWFENYRTTYMEKDLRSLTQVANIRDFQRYYEMLAYQVGNLINFSNIARDLGISTNTSKKFFSILNSSYQYFAMQPFYVNINKRLIKTPKVYSYDTGLCNFFLKYRNNDELINSGKWGNIFENWVIVELMKQNTMLNENINFSFWRTFNGAEIDLILEYGQKIIPIEIKTTSNLRKESFKSLTIFMEDLEPTKKIPFGIILYTGERVYQVSNNIIALPIEYIFSS